LDGFVRPEGNKGGGVLVTQGGKHFGGNANGVAMDSTEVDGSIVAV
jgi:hypothetical protein